MAAINLRDYSRTAAQRGWGAGWPSCGGAKAAGTAVVSADVSGTRMSVHKRIARLVDLLIDATERRGYRLKSGQTGGYNCRPIGGTSSPSNHSWGLAVDINWQSNPMKRPLTTDMPAWMVAMWNRYGFAWGGHYTSTPDAMHYEFMGTPAQADQMTALALRELTGGSTTTPVPPTAPAAPTPPAPVLVRHPTEDATMHVYSAEPTRDAQGNAPAKNRWPARTVTVGFDPATTKDLRLHWGSRGGWLHSARWWVRDAGWTPNNPKHSPRDHAVGQGGSERFIGFGWVATPPTGADELEVTFSAPDGLHIFPAPRT